MKSSRYRRIVGDLLGSSSRAGGPRAGAREVQIRAHRGPGDHRRSTTFTGLTRPNRYY